MIEEIFKVRYHEIGIDGDVPLWILQNYFQEGAGLDAHNLSYGWEELSPKGVAWIITKLQFKILKKVTSAQNIKVKTWHCYSDKIQSRRDFVLYDEAGDEIMKGVSWWLILDLAKRKIVRSPEELVAQNDSNPKPIMEAEIKKNPSFEDKTPLTETPITARLEDMDVNGHANNAHFSAWAIGGVPEDVRKNKQLSDVFVNFKAEVMLNDKITVKTYEDGENAYWHILIREADGKEISSVYTSWK